MIGIGRWQSRNAKNGAYRNRFFKTNKESGNVIRTELVLGAPVVAKHSLFPAFVIGICFAKAENPPGM
jgi:hypothetical protein